MQVNLRKVVPADIELMRYISILTFMDTYASQNTPENVALHISENFNEDRLLSELKDDNSIFFFAESNSKPLGYIKLNKQSAQTESLFEDAAELERIYVIPEAKGQGIGRRMFQKSVELAENWNLDLLWLGVWENNPKAIEFYQQMGMKKHGTHTFTVGEEDQTDFVMVLKL